MTLHSPATQDAMCDAIARWQKWQIQSKKRKGQEADAVKRIANLERERDEAREAYTAETQSTIEMAAKIAQLEDECTRLHKLWSDAYHENECARVTMCKYGAAFAAETLSGVIVRTIEVLDNYRHNA